MDTKTKKIEKDRKRILKGVKGSGMSFGILSTMIIKKMFKSKRNFA